jgi:hypothetical protein
MDTNVIAVLLSFGLYLLYVLLPLIPAILIYRLFPDTKVAVSGPLAGLTLKASGAFAAYVVVVVLGVFLVKDTHTIIAGSTQPVWTIRAQVELYDRAGKKVDDQSSLQYLEVVLNPDIRAREGSFIRLQVPGTANQLPEYLISFKLKQFGEQTISIAELGKQEVEVDDFKRILKIIQPIKIIQSHIDDRPYKPTGYQQPTGGVSPPPQ